MNCADCKYNDGYVYTSLPPKYRCTITGEYNFGEHECNVEFVPVVRCKECKYYDAENHNCIDEMAYARVWNETDYCSFGERKDDE